MGLQVRAAKDSNSIIMSGGLNLGRKSAAGRDAVASAQPGDPRLARVTIFLALLNAGNAGFGQ